MKPAIIVVDMIKDNVDIGAPYSMGEEGRKIIPNLQRLISSAREMGIPVIFANDSFLPNDFLFKGKIKPHSIRGTEGAEVIDELEPVDTDIVLPKRRMSAFFKTDLDMTLRTLDVDTIVVCGISTQVCVLTTAMDGLANDFRVVLLEDCCACASRADHETVIGLLRRPGFAFLLSVVTSEEFLDSLRTA